MRQILAVTGAVLLLALQGCVSVNKQAFNHAAHKEIKEIVILEPKEWKDYEAVVMNHPGMGFGLIGGLIAAAEIATKSNTLTKALQPFEWEVSQALSAQLEADLKEAGYSVKRLAVLREGGLLENYKNIRTMDSAHNVTTTPNAWLDVAVAKPAYLANSHGADYVPSLRTFVRLVTGDKHLVVYEEQIFYGHAMPANFGPVSLKAAPTYAFSNMDALVANPAVTLDGFKDGIKQVSARIAADLRHADQRGIATGATGGGATNAITR